MCIELKVVVAVVSMCDPLEKTRTNTLAHFTGPPVSRGLGSVSPSRRAKQHPILREGGKQHPRDRLLVVTGSHDEQRFPSYNEFPLLVIVK